MNLTTEQRALITSSLACTPAELDAKLATLAAAANEEYLRMILGQRVFTRGQDILEYRLLLLIQHLFGNRIPPEQVVCNLFQTTLSQSRTLIRSVLAKYQYELQGATRSTIKEVLSCATSDINDSALKRLTIVNASVVDAINRLITSIDGSLTVVSKVPGTGSTYQITASSFDRLIAILP